MHGCKASWVEEVPVKESFKDETVWDGTVHVFDLTGHPEATRAYTWSWHMPGRSKHTYFAVLKLPPVFSPRDAVRAAIVESIELGTTQRDKNKKSALFAKQWESSHPENPPANSGRQKQN
jgi:hypothetical protein